MPNKAYFNEETTIIWGSEVGDDEAWTTESVADGAGRQGAHHDFGTTARAAEYRYRFHTQAVATPTLRDICELKWKTSDGTHHDNDDGTGDIAVSAKDKLRNLLALKPAIVDEAAANIEYVSRGRLVHVDRYGAPVVFNEMGSAITADAAETKFHLTPIPPEIQ